MMLVLLVLSVVDDMGVVVYVGAVVLCALL